MVSQSSSVSVVSSSIRHPYLPSSASSDSTVDVVSQSSSVSVVSSSNRHSYISSSVSSVSILVC